MSRHPLHLQRVANSVTPTVIDLAGNARLDQRGPQIVHEIEQDDLSREEITNHLSPHSYRKKLKNKDSHRHYMDNTSHTRNPQPRKYPRKINGIHGDALGSKDDGSVRIMFENFNGLAAWKPRNEKITMARRLLHRLQVDCYAGAECNVQWSIVKHHHQLRQLFKTEVEINAVSAHNINEHDGRLQQGGTAIITFDRMATLFKHQGVDPTGLGRWCWMKTTGKHNMTTRIISAYQPCRSSPKRLDTVYSQQRRYFKLHGDTRCPRAIFRSDLHSLLKIWIDAGDKVLLLIDANEDLSKGPLSSKLKSLQMYDAIAKRSGIPGPATFATGLNQIDGAFFSRNFECTGARFLPLWTGIGDHRAIIIDIPQQLIYGEQLLKVILPTCRRLQCNIKKVRDKYNAKLLSLCILHKLPNKYQHLINTSTLEDVTEFSILQDKIDTTKTEYMIASEKKCRKICAGAVDYSDEIIIWRNRRDLWNLIHKYKKGYPVSTTYIRRKAHILGVVTPLSCTEAEAHKALTTCTHNYEKLKPNSPSLRKQFLNRLKNEAISRKDEPQIARLKQIILREALKSTWLTINNAKKRKSGSSISKVTVTINGISKIIATQEPLEDAVMTMCDAKFKLTHDSQLMNGSNISKDVGYLGNSPACARLLSGTYIFPSDTDLHTKDLMSLISKTTRRLKAKIISHKISVDDFINYWKGSREKTSSSFSGLHFGHWKAASHSRALASIHAKSIELAFRMGLPLKRWKVGLSVMLEKIPGITLVDKLRAILLMEADFNFGNKLLLGKRMVQAAEKLNFIPQDNFGSRNNKSAPEVCVCRLLFFDIVRLSKLNAALGSYDAQTCYDRVVHSLTSMIAQSVGVPIPNIVCMFLALQGMNFYLRTAFGDSTRSYGCTSNKPYQGLVQGNGAAPALWLLVSSYILLYLKSKGHGLNVKSAIHGTALTYVALMYVDDGDFPTIATSNKEKVKSVASRHQDAVTCWTGGLGVTGGALKPAKCFWYPIGWKWVEGIATIIPAKQVRAEILVTGPDKVRAAVTKLDHTEAREIMGIWQAPNGKMKAQLTKMADCINDYKILLDNGYLNRKTIWISFWGSHWPALKYALPALSLSKEEGDKLMRPLYKSLLPKLGVVGSLPFEYRYGSLKYHGLGLPNIYLENIIEVINVFTVHFPITSMVGQHLQQVSERLQMEVGIDTPFLHLPFHLYGVYTTPNYLGHLWKQIANLPLRIECRKQPTMQLQREGDKYIMELIVKLQKYSPTELTSINNVRLALRCYSLADILDGAGKYIQPFVFKRRRRHIKSKFNWPKSKPSYKDFYRWKDAILTLSPFKRLGAWHHTESSHTTCKYDPTTKLLYIPKKRKWKIFSPKEQRHTRAIPSYYLSGSTTIIPHNLERGTFDYNRDGSIQFSGSAPVLLDTNTPPTTLVEIFNTWGEIWIWEFIQIQEEGKWLAEALTNNSAQLVCDGSYQPNLTTTRGSAAWTIECQTTKKRAMGMTATTTDTANAYRSELTGLYAALALVLAVSQLHQIKSGSLQAGCDNEQAVFLSSVIDTKVPTSKSHSDVLRSIRLVCLEMPIDITFHHIKGHQDDTIMYDNLDRPSQLNVDCDLVAKAGLRRLHRQNNPQPDALPHENVMVWIRNKKIIGNVGPALRNEVSRLSMKAFLCNPKRAILTIPAFDEVDWQSVEVMMKNEPQQFNLWISKHVSGFCGTNKMLYKRKQSSSPYCPVCKHPNIEESTRHQALCRDTYRQQIWIDSVSHLDKWLAKVDTHPTLHYCITEYMLRKGTRSMRNILRGAELLPLALSQDEIGWENFTEGKISKWFKIIQRGHYIKEESLRSSGTWTSKLIKRLLLILHDQWVHRNNIVHKRNKDGQKESTAAALRINIRAQLHKGTHGLAPEDHFLVDYSFSDVNQWDVSYKKTWLTAITTARSLINTSTSVNNIPTTTTHHVADNPEITMPPANHPRLFSARNRKRRNTNRNTHPDQRKKRKIIRVSEQSPPIETSAHREGTTGRGKHKRTHQSSTWKSTRKRTRLI